MKKIIIIGYVGGGNLGDEICAKVLLERLEELAPQAVCEVVRVAAHPLRELVGMRKRLEGADAVIFAGGNLLQNETSNRSLYYYLKIIKTAKALGTRVLFLSSGIGEIRGLWHERRAYRTLSGPVAFFGARSSADAARAGRISGAEVLLMPDMAFAISRDFSASRENIFAYIPKLKTIPSSDFFAKIKRETGCEGVVAPFFIKKDLGTAKRISQRSGANLLVCERYEEVLSLIGKSAFVVTERLHGAILALICGTPAFISAREQKAKDLVDEVRRRALSLGIASPIRFSDELTAEKIKELGASRSEFKLLLDNLRNDTEEGLARLLDIIGR